MEVLVARYAGVCYGVQRALKLASEAAERDVPVHSLGPLIHNPQAVEALKDLGVDVADAPSDAGSGMLVIRSHGVGPSIIADARSRGLEVVDATCPHVTKAHEAAEKLRADGYAVVIVGEADHPEVEGIMAHAGGEAIVVESAAELPHRLPSRRVGVVVQTTQSESRLTEVVAALLPRVHELEVHNTICSATAKRQQSAAELAAEVDVVVVVGGHNSGNTTRLAEICREVNPRTFHVETSADLEEEWFDGSSKVGVTAGASTPSEQMDGVIQAIEAMNG